MRYVIGYVSILCGLSWGLPSEQATQEAAKRSANAGFQSLCRDYIDLLQKHKALHNRLSGGSGINGFATPEEAEVMKGIAAWDAACQSLDGPVTAAPNLPGVLGAHSQTINDIYAAAWAAYQKAATSTVTTSGQTTGTPPAPPRLPPPPPLNKPGQTTVGAAQPPVGLPPPPPRQAGSLPPPPPPQGVLPPPLANQQPILDFKPTIGGPAGGPPKPPPPPPPPPAKPVVAAKPKSTSPTNTGGTPTTQQSAASGGMDVDGVRRAQELKARTPLRNIKWREFENSQLNTPLAKQYLKMYPIYKKGETIPADMGIFDEDAAKTLGAYLVDVLSKVPNDESLRARLKRMQLDNANLDSFYAEYTRTKPSDSTTPAATLQKPNVFKNHLANRRRGITGQHSDNDSDDDDDNRSATAQTKPSATQPSPLQRQDSWENEDDFSEVPADFRTGLNPMQFKGICKKLKAQGIVWNKTPEAEFRKAFENAKPKPTAKPAALPRPNSSDSDDEGGTVFSPPKPLPQPASTSSTSSAGISLTPVTPPSTTPVFAKGNNPYSEWIDVNKLTSPLSDDPAVGLLALDSLTNDEKETVKRFLKNHLDDLMPAVKATKRVGFRQLVNS